jgi:hypothetical protein
MQSGRGDRRATTSANRTSLGAAVASMADAARERASPSLRSVSTVRCRDRPNQWPSAISHRSPSEGGDATWQAAIIWSIASARS